MASTSPISYSNKSLNHIGSQGYDKEDFKLGGDSGPDTSEQEPNEDDQYDFESVDIIPGRKRKHAHSSSIISKQTQMDDTEAFTLEDDSTFPNQQTSHVPSTYGRTNRSKSDTHMTYSKPVSHELDSDDQLMMQMRKNGCSDRQIAETLARDRGVHYDPNSISTRIVRLRAAQADHVDFLLKEGYKEWEYKHDQLLLQAYALADIEANYEIERIRAWRFRKVSEYMRRLNEDALFSAAACRERYDALIQGTACIPSDLDDDPAARRAEMAAYRTAREQTRAKEQAENDAKAAAEAKRKVDAKSLKAQKAQDLVTKRRQQEADKAKRAAERAEKAKHRAARAKEKQDERARRVAQVVKQKQAKEAEKLAAKKKKKKEEVKTGSKNTVKRRKVTTGAGTGAVGDGNKDSDEMVEMESEK